LFLAWELSLENAEGKPRSEGPVSAPFDLEVDSSEFIAMSKLTPLEQVTQLVSVQVWTPTQRAYSQKLALLDDAA
jgi:hypothetical protein